MTEQNDTPLPADGGGGVYGSYIKSLLDYEQVRKSSLETKASAVVATSGTLVTLLFGLVAVVTGAKNFLLPQAAHGWLGAAMLFFVAAAGIAIGANVIPVPYGEVTFSGDDLPSVWRNPAAVAAIQVATAQLQQIEKAKDKNDMKAKLVLVSGVSELLALVMLTIALLLIIGVHP